MRYGIFHCRTSNNFAGHPKLSNGWALRVSSLRFYQCARRPGRVLDASVFGSPDATDGCLRPCGLDPVRPCAGLQGFSGVPWVGASGSQNLRVISDVTMHPCFAWAGGFRPAQDNWPAPSAITSLSLPDDVDRGTYPWFDRRMPQKAVIAITTAAGRLFDHGSAPQRRNLRVDTHILNLIAPPEEAAPATSVSRRLMHPQP